MEQNKIKYLEEEEFHKLTETKPETFEKMLEMLSEQIERKKQEADIEKS